MRSFLFLTRDYLRANARQAGFLLAWVLSIVLVLTSGTALVVLPPDGGGTTQITERFLLLSLDPLVSEAEVARMGWEVGGWPGVLGVTFRFPGEQEPVPIESRTLVVEIQPGGAGDGVAARLAGMPGIRAITPMERSVTRLGMPSGARIGALVALILSLALALWLGFRISSRGRRLWSAEWAVLRQSGLSPLYLRGPSLVLAFLVGIVAAGIYVGLLLGLQSLGSEILIHHVPELLDLIPLALGVAFPVAVVISLLGGFLSPHS